MLLEEKGFFFFSFSWKLGINFILLAKLNMQWQVLNSAIILPSKEILAEKQELIFIKIANVSC